jgi:hypothetical protein
MAASPPPAITPDTKDWTWVINRRCPECGFVAPAPTEVAARIEATIPRWTSALQRSDVAVRSDPHRWSVLEYGCHVRDVCRVFDGRLAQLLTTDAPTFADWDQDQAAIDGHYHEQPPGPIAADYARQAGQIAGRFARVRDDQWPRRGTRSNGSQFTVGTLAVYFLHDLEHHLHDVGG